MALLSDSDKNKVQRILERLSQLRGYPIDYSKAQVNTAVQAMEDEFETNVRSQFGAAIESAVPGIFTNAQKKAIGKAWLTHKVGVE